MSLTGFLVGSVSGGDALSCLFVEGGDGFKRGEDWWEWGGGGEDGMVIGVGYELCTRYVSDVCRCVSEGKYDRERERGLSC